MYCIQLHNMRGQLVLKRDTHRRCIVDGTKHLLHLADALQLVLQTPQCALQPCRRLFHLRRRGMLERAVCLQTKRIIILKVRIQMLQFGILFPPFLL